jgi:hypothetical protein
MDMIVQAQTRRLQEHQHHHACNNAGMRQIKHGNVARTRTADENLAQLCVCQVLLEPEANLRHLRAK